MYYRFAFDLFFLLLLLFFSDKTSKIMCDRVFRAYQEERASFECGYNLKVIM